jgi:hypothetical protein
VLLSNGTRSTPPLGEEPQGPSPVEYELELEVDFPPEMVLEMQEGVVRKAQKIRPNQTGFIKGRNIVNNNFLA